MTFSCAKTVLSTLYLMTKAGFKSNISVTEALTHQLYELYAAIFVSLKTQCYKINPV